MALVQRRSASGDDRPARNLRTVAPAADDDGDEEEDERPARRRATAPAFKAPKRTHDDDDDLPEEEEDERPRGRRGPSSDAVKSGWGAARKLKEEGGDYASEFKFPGRGQAPALVKFLSDEPFAVYKQHWIEGLRSTKKRSFICLGKGCPLCAIPETYAKKWAFNIAVFDEDGEAEAKALIAGSRLFDDIADEHEKNKGIDKGFYTLSKSGQKQSVTYKVKYVKERDLEEDWKITPEDAEDAMVGLELYTSEQYQPSTKSYLQEIADEITDGED